MFGHTFHTAAFGCDQCHPKLFAMKKSGKLKMEPMYGGKSCGACHNGQMAFASTECAKCHDLKAGFGKDVKYEEGERGLWCSATSFTRLPLDVRSVIRSCLRRRRAAR
ncbi:MAG: cytochrome c3 family protein [Bacillus subtilis]|nr:cytochrome c3 family protein [Bacillus subtilis]